MRGPDPGEEYLRYKEALRGERLPLAFVDLDRLEANADYVAGLVRGSGKTARVHSKSLRCPALIRHILERDPEVFQGLMTFTLEETAWLAESGLDDFIVAYPTVQESDLEILCGLARAGVRVSLMIDCPEHLEALERAGDKAGTVLSACLDLDLAYRPLGGRIHLGMRRSPVRTPAQALDLARASLGMGRVGIDSVMGYEGHVASLGDDLPGKGLMNLAARALKRLSIAEYTPRRGRIVERLRRAGLELRAVNGGGSGSLVSTLGDPSLTEVTVGSAFFAPGLFQHFREVRFTPAAFFALQAVRRPGPGLVTCLGGGYVASGPAGADKLPGPVFPPGLGLTKLEGAGEVQTPLRLPPDGPGIGLGDPVIMQHAKAGELAERFNQLLLIRGDRVVDRVDTYRGQGKAFL